MSRGSPGKLPGGPLEPSCAPYLKGSWKQELYTLNQGIPGLDSGCPKCPGPALVGSPLPWCGIVGEGQTVSFLHLLDNVCTSFSSEPNTE